MTAAISSWTGVEIDRKDVQCLARNIYHEARGESVEGQLGVAFVTLNRAEKRGLSICKTVYQKNQFEWTKYKKRLKEKDAEAWKMSVETAAFVLAGMITVDPTNGADHFYAPEKTSPDWAESMNQTAMIGNHLFLRSDG